MAESPAQFAQLLTEAIYRIRFAESKTIRAVQDELGNAIGKRGGASIEYWRKGNLPKNQSDVATLAREIVARSDVQADWLMAFLASANFPQAAALRDELFPAGFPTTTTPGHSPPAGERHNLPIPTTPFIGRQAALQTIGQQLHDPNCRLLALIGPGGIGKTRLALQAAHQQIPNFRHGVYFANLAYLKDAGQLTATIANAIQFSFYSGEPLQLQLLSYLRDKQMLLVLDNFEHLVAAASLLSELLATAPRLKILVTSRERLNLQGEWNFVVRPMSFPHPASGSSEPTADTTSPAPYSAVSLFLASARRVNIDFEPTPETLPHIIRICQLAGGLPLALELAAAWVRLLSCQEIADEIERNLNFLATSWRDLPERHRSLEAVFEYSWHLLSPAERAAMSRLSVLRGGFRREAAIRVADAPLRLLSSLADKSLLHPVPAGGATPNRPRSELRYEMHELLRRFAAGKLNDGPGRQINGQFTSLLAEETRDRHSRYFAEFLRARRDHLKGARQKAALQEMSQEIENLRAAWQWAVTQGQVEVIGQSLETLSHFYDIRSWVQEGAEIFAAAAERLHHLPRPGEDAKRIRGQALARQGSFQHQLANYQEAERLLQEALTQAQIWPAPHEAAYALNHLGKVAYRTGNYALAAQHCQQSLHICRQEQYSWGMIGPLETLGHVDEERGHYNQARAWYEEGLALCRQIRNQRGIATFLNGLGFVQWRLGELAEARRLCQASLNTYRDVGDRRGIAMAYKNLGNIAASAGEVAVTQAHYRTSLAICREIGYQWGVAAMLNNLGNSAWRQGQYPEAKALCQESLLIWQRIGDQWGQAGTLETLGNVELALGQTAPARSHLLTALTIASAIQAIPLVLDVLIGLARLLAHEGHPGRALELLDYVRQHPAADQEGRDKAAELLADLRQKGVIASRPGPTSSASPPTLAQIVAGILGAGTA